MISDRIGFVEQLDKEFTTLSGGQKQLVVVIRSLLHHPSLVFLDEPSKSLAPVTAENVRTFLLDYAQAHGMTVLLTTHNMDEAEAVCDRLTFINQGRLQFAGTPQQFRHSVCTGYCTGFHCESGWHRSTATAIPRRQPCGWE